MTVISVLKMQPRYLNIKPCDIKKVDKAKDRYSCPIRLDRLWKFKKSELDEWVNSGKKRNSVDIGGKTVEVNRT